MPDTEELTPWFPPEVKPVRRGWYQRDYLGRPAYAHWDGRSWSMGCFHLIDREFVKNIASAYQSIPWRGRVRAAAAISKEESRNG